MSEIISKDIQPVVIQVASAEDAATLARIETGIRTAAQNVVQGYLTIGSYLNEAKGRKIVPHGQWEDWVLYNTGLSLRQAQQLMKAAREIPEGSAMAALPMSKARVILHLPDAEEREALAKRAAEENLTVRTLEEQVRQLTDDVCQARKNERQMAQAVQQAQDLRTRLEHDRSEMMQERQEKQAEIERLQKALAQAEQQGGISPEAQRQIDALRQEVADAEDYAEQQAVLRQEAQRQLLEQQSNTVSGTGKLPDALDLAAAVRVFIGAAGIFPHMGTTLASMDSGKRQELAGYVDMIADWVDGARAALNSCTGVMYVIGDEMHA
ncbi:MAG: DUF3102 domain-containing protein [Clostridia bacterium]|nr:DUF3102 domain-containing protein [Clostridia bacterium]